MDLFIYFIVGDFFLGVDFEIIVLYFNGIIIYIVNEDDVFFIVIDILMV